MSKTYAFSPIEIIGAITAASALSTALMSITGRTASGQKNITEDVKHDIIVNTTSTILGGMLALPILLGVKDKEHSIEYFMLAGKITGAALLCSAASLKIGLLIQNNNNSSQSAALENSNNNVTPEEYIENNDAEIISYLDSPYGSAFKIGVTTLIGALCTSHTVDAKGAGVAMGIGIVALCGAIIYGWSNDSPLEDTTNVVNEHLADELAAIGELAYTDAQT